MDNESFVVVNNTLFTHFRHIELIFDLLLILSFSAKGFTELIDQKDQVFDINPPSCHLIIVYPKFLKLVEMLGGYCSGVLFIR